METKFLNQYREWLTKAPFSWSNFSVIEISFEKDRVSMDYSFHLIILGLGIYIHYMTKAGKAHWEQILEEMK